METITTFTFNETEPYENGYSSYYEKNIIPILAEFNEKRKKLLVFAAIYLLVIIDVLVSITTHFFDFHKQPFIFIALTTMFVLNYILFYVLGPLLKHIKETEKSILKKILEFSGNHYFNSLENNTSEENEVCISGNYRNKKIKILESVLDLKSMGYRRGAEWDWLFKKHKRRVFYGTIIHIKLNEPLKGITKIRNHKNITNFLTGVNETKDLKDIPPNHSEFKKHFKVFSSNEMETFQFLTIGFMESLLELRKFVDSRNAKAEFDGKNIFIQFLHNENLLDLSLIKNTESLTSESKAIFKKVDLIFQVIDKF